MKNFNKDLFKDITLLYVEDDEMTIEEISFFLKRYVKKFIIAKNGEEGLSLFKEHNPDMVITDIQMPIMNGLEMAKKIFEINPSVPIAVTTAYSDSEYIMNAIEIGIDKYLLKPIDMSEVLAVILKSLHLDSLNVKVCEEYINYILDNNPTFMFTMDSNKIKYANKSLLNLLGYENINSFNDEIKECTELFEFSDIKIKDNFIEYIMNHPDKKFLVNLKNKNREVCYDRKFHITYKKFENMNKSIFMFVEDENYKLHEINNIVKDLVDDIDNNELILNKVHRLLQLTSAG